MGTVHRLKPRTGNPSAMGPAITSRAPLPEPQALFWDPGAFGDALRREILALAQSPQIQEKAPASDEFRLHIARAAIAMYMLEVLGLAASAAQSSPADSAKASRLIQSFLAKSFFAMSADDLRDGYNALRSELEPAAAKLRLALLPPDEVVRRFVPSLSREIDSINGF